MEISPIKLNLRYNISPQNKNNRKDVFLKNQNFSFHSYPSNYYLSFGKTVPKKLVKNIGEENFPSPKILESVKSAYKNDVNFSLYDAHTSYYKGLLNCKTLDEAKEKYPEFKDVIDAKNVGYSDMPYSVKQICRGEKPVKIEDLSLEVLKRYYAKAKAPNNYNTEEYFGFGKKAVYGIMDILNIKRYDKAYASYLYKQEPSVTETASINQKAYHDKHPDVSRKHSEFMIEYSKRPEVQERLHSADNDPEVRAHRSEAAKKYFSEHPERAIEHGIYMREYFANNPHVGKAISVNLKKFHFEHPEYALLRQYTCTKIFPDYCAKMSEIAKDFPGLKAIRTKQENGIKLTPAEISYNKMYFAKCGNEIGGMCTDIGLAYKKLVNMFKLSKNADSNEKINQIEEFFSDEEKVKQLMLELRGTVI